MLTDPSEGELLKMLVKLSGSKKGIEIGVFTGYSSICMAEALPDDGHLLCSDVNGEFTDLAKKYWQITGLQNKVELILKPGLEILDNLLTDSKNIGAYDFAYVDADKSNYINYYERLLKLIHPGGFIAFDNTLWSYKVVYEEFNDDDTVGLRQLNSFLQSDSRVEITMVPISDGITIVRIR
jgi:predicted O-methyltransferase YrrM